MEIIGKVQNDLSVKVMASTDMGPEGNIGKCPISSAGVFFFFFFPPQRTANEGCVE